MASHAKTGATPGIDLSKADLVWNRNEAQLYEQAVLTGEGKIAKDGPLVVTTGKHTGRSANDKFVVRDESTENTVWWDANASMTPDQFKTLRGDFEAHL